MGVDVVHGQPVDLLGRHLPGGRRLDDHLPRPRPPHGRRTSRSSRRCSPGRCGSSTRLGWPSCRASGSVRSPSVAAVLLTTAGCSGSGLVAPSPGARARDGREPAGRPAAGCRPRRARRRTTSPTTRAPACRCRRRGGSEIQGTVSDGSGAIPIDLDGWLLVTYPYDDDRRQPQRRQHHRHRHPDGRSARWTGYSGALLVRHQHLDRRRPGDPGRSSTGADVDIVTERRDDDVVYAELIDGLTPAQRTSTSTTSTSGVTGPDQQPADRHRLGAVLGRRVVDRPAGSTSAAPRARAPERSPRSTTRRSPGSATRVASSARFERPTRAGA